MYVVGQIEDIIEFNIREVEYMKKAFFCILTFVLAFCMSSCGADKKETEKEETHCYMEAKTVSFETMEEMEQYADVIICGKRLDEKKDVIDKSEDGAVYSAYSYTKVQVEKVFKDTIGDLAKNSEITVLENEAYDQETGITYHVAGYNQMVAGNSYLLFLKRDKLEDGSIYYVSCGVNYGTISLEEDGRTKTHMKGETFDGTEFDAYKDIWEKAKNKYIK